jgi:tetratricopeptide (TPR) repeat protein
MVEQARADRPAQAEAEAGVTVRSAPPPDPEREALVIQLRTIMEQRTDDAQGLALLAGNEAALGNFRAARLAQGRLVEILGDAATGRNHIDLAEMMVLAAGGYVSPEAEAALERGLALTPQDGTARYYAGLMFARQGRPDLAFPIWRSLLADSSPDAPWLDPIRLQIEEVAYLAGVNVTLADLPQPRGGPTSPRYEGDETARRQPHSQSRSPSSKRLVVSHREHILHLRKVSLCGHIFVCRRWQEGDICYLYGVYFPNVKLSCCIYCLFCMLLSVGSRSVFSGFLDIRLL